MFFTSPPLLILPLHTPPAPTHSSLPLRTTPQTSPFYSLSASPSSFANAPPSLHPPLLPPFPDMPSFEPGLEPPTPPPPLHPQLCHWAAGLISSVGEML